MKIRKANIVSEDKMITDVYLHENKKQSHTLVAVPELEWSALISYEEEKRSLVQKLKQSLAKNMQTDAAEELSQKIVQWVTEM
ncbi:YueH family protein [Bacillus sonorensis]|uniref:YueH family protein n=1 Tax=Bacillus sonorensis TaxID=119858 RepID=UPI0022E2EA95|nr:YueH family protein [Bacillus sonorensis]